MSGFRVALMQLMPGRTTGENLEKGVEYCKKASAMGADVALFPEMWSCGYTIDESDELNRRNAVSPEGEFVTRFGELANELDMAIAITYLEAASPKPRNTVTLFDRFGKRALDYSKVHTCVFGDERRLSPGDDFRVVSLDTRSGSVLVGAMICYDREFPESARILMLRGAETILVPNACPMELNRLSQLRGRAYENMLGIATANYPYGQPDCNGHSSAFDGMAYREGGHGSRDTLVIEAGEREGIYLADFPIDEMREYRAREVHGNAYRRPDKYGELVLSGVKPPFTRPERIS